MDKRSHPIAARGFLLGLVVLCGVMSVAILLVLYGSARPAYADPIPPPVGHPKLSLSVKTVTPTLAHIGGPTLSYAIEIRNTGAYAALGASLTDAIPAGTSYKGDAQASAGTVSVAGQTLTWHGDVGFDATVIVSFSVGVPAAFAGTVQNTAVISHPLIASPVTVTAETVVTDEPVLALEKSSLPVRPGANKPLTYTIVVVNQGQPAVNLPVTVTDHIPLNTTLSDLGDDATSDGTDVTWTRRVTMELGETSTFTFSVQVGSVPSGTVINNSDYRVASPASGVTAGDPYTVTIVDPIFMLSKHVWPDPPGSNREMTFTLELLNVGSLATDLVVSDQVPAGVEYRRGGTKTGNTVSWSLPSLDTGEKAEFTYTVYVGDVMAVPVVNNNYTACSGEGVCHPGDTLTSVVGGPTFEAIALLDPIAKKPGGGTGPVTPTLVVRNLGPGNALGATALIELTRISVSNVGDLEAIPPVGTFSDGPECGANCYAYLWTGDLPYGEAVTLTTNINKGTRGRSTIGGEEGTIYTATVVVTDSLNNTTTAPITGTATGRVTHYANLLPIKSAPPVIGRGQLMTYTILVRNSGLSTDEPPAPVLTDVVPLSTTVVHISDGGTAQVVSGSTRLSWTLPAMSPGDEYERSFTVRVNGGLVSGTQIINQAYGVTWSEAETSTLFSNVGDPVTTTVQEVGLIDSFKEVTPAVMLPGPDNVVTYTVHVVNTSPLPLTGVQVYDLLPWESSTYQRDAVASAGQIVSDIVSVHWTGNVGAFSSEIVTLTVRVDPDYQGPLTNTATINHPDLLHPVEVHAVAYVTEEPVLEIVKSAAPDPVTQGKELAYTIRVANLGQQATALVVTDTIPADTEYVAASATAGGQLVGNQLRWTFPALGPGESRTLGFKVTVQASEEVVNDEYAVTCAQGVVAIGEPVVTQVRLAGGKSYLPLISRNAP